MQPGLAGALTECLKTKTWTVRQSTRQRPLREREQRWQQPGGKTRDERSLEKRQLRRIQQELRHEPSKVQENVQPIGLYCWTAFYDPPRARCQTAASAPATIRARLSAQRFVTQSSVAGQRQRSRSGRSARGKKCCHQGMICCCRARAWGLQICCWLGGRGGGALHLAAAASVSSTAGDFWRTRTGFRFNVRGGGVHCDTTGG